MNPEDELYQELLLQHSRRPKNYGAVPHPTHLAEGFNALCGDEITIAAIVENETISDLRFTASACAICTASASMMTGAIKGKSCTEARSLSSAFRSTLTGDAESTLPDGLSALSAVRRFPARVKCAALPWETMVSALNHPLTPAPEAPKHPEQNQAPPPD